MEAEELWARVAAVERQAQSALAGELDAALAARGQAEAQLTGEGRDALLALRGSAQVLAVRHESTQRLLGELRAELAEARTRPGGPSAGRARPGRRRSRCCRPGCGPRA